MIRLARAPDIILGQHWANLLEQAGIPCRLSGHYLSGAAGEIPVDQCGPDLWIEFAEDRERAMRIIEGRVDPSATALAPWYCGRCGEYLEWQFTACWQCGATRE